MVYGVPSWCSLLPDETQKKAPLPFATGSPLPQNFEFSFMGVGGERCGNELIDLSGASSRTGPSEGRP